MSWENDMANMFKEAKNYKKDKQLMIIKAVVIKANPFTLASHGGAIIYKEPTLIITQTVKDQIQGFLQNNVEVINKQIVIIGNQDEYVAVSFC